MTAAVAALVLCTAVTCLMAAAGALAAPPRGNVLFMLTDDGGFEIGPYGGGVVSNTSTTPNYDALASSGVVFDHAYTAVSSCSPSRSAILSGLPTHQNGMWGLHNDQQNFASHDAVQSLPKILSDSGYYTCAVGKYHLGVDTAHLRTYPFDFGLDPIPGWEPQCCSAGGTCQQPYNQLARNITHIRLCAAKCIEQAAAADKPFFLYIGWGDVHRCKFEGPTGSFCEKYGNGEPGQGTDPEWAPRTFAPSEVAVPPFLPDNAAVRADIAAQYTVTNRMDQGLGLVLGEVDKAGHTEDTLVMSFSDNGIPFPHAKTTLYETGMREPLIVRSPLPAHAASAGTRDNTSMVSSLDFTPTILDWAGASYPTYKLNGATPRLYGASILPLLGASTSSTAADERAAVEGQLRVSPGGPGPGGPGTSGSAFPTSNFSHVFASHSMHSVWGYYPMRVVRTARFRFIRNVAHWLPYPILGDVWETATWQAIVANATHSPPQPTGWVYDYDSYVHRPEVELYDTVADPLELHNLAGDPQYNDTVAELSAAVMAWQEATHDPWLVKYTHE